ncbi:MAG: O-antigen ligase family protein [Elainellaceae cyanobacterium]
MALLIEKAFTVLALFLYSGAIGLFIGDTNPLAPVKFACAIAGFLIASCLLLLRFKRALAVANRDKFLWILISFTILSVVWSDYPQVTATHAFTLFRVTIFGLYFATRYTISEQMKLIAWALGIGAVLSLVVAVLFPYYGVMGYGLVITMELNKHTGIWRGVYIHKTTLGTMMTLGTLAFIYCRVQIRGSQLYRWATWAGAAFCFGMLMMSTTKAALAILIIVLVMIPFFRALRWNYSYAIPFFIILLLVGGSAIVFLVANAEPILTSLGRDITISGRTIYWPLMIAKALQRPWFGYGQATFWHGGWKGEPADIWRFLADGDEPPHAHNGFINVWLSIGIIGLILFALSYFTACLRAIKWVRTVKTAEGLVPLCFLVLIILLNLTESLLMEPELVWLYYVSMSLSMHNRFIKRPAFEPDSLPATSDITGSELIKPPNPVL